MCGLVIYPTTTMKTQSAVLEGGLYRFACPWCESLVEVRRNHVNCRIFRCGVYKTTGRQLGPHTSKEECDRLANGGLIWGCGRPFKFHFSGDGEYVDRCEYI
jgi:hypothetical protein